MSEPLKVVITGAGGQLGQALLRIKPENMHVTGLNHSQLDIADADAVRRTINSIQPDVVINAAAYTAVDKAESEPAQAAAINAGGVRNLALALKSIQHGRLIHVSTDFIFDGRSSVPYPIDAAANPLSVYGRTKHEAECIARNVLNERALIVRTAWVYASTGKNFMLTMLRLMKERGEVRVVADQIGTPTSAQSLANVLWQCVLHPEVSGVLHWTDAGVASWYDFAVAIAEESVAMKLLATMPKITPIATADYPTPAKRPAYSVLDKSGIYRQLNIMPVHWRQELRNVLGALKHA